MLTYRDLLSHKEFLKVAARARQVAAVGGGTNLFAIAYKDNRLYFKTRSATNPNLFYVQIVELQALSFEKIISAKTFRDVERLIKDGAIKVSCTCAAWHYYFKYVAWKNGYGLDKELRRPIIRNPWEVKSVCFVAGTPVLTDKGYVPIEQLKVGDLVFTHKGRLQPVLATSSHQVDSTISVRYGNTTIVSTPNHPYLACPKIGKSNASTTNFDPSLVDWTSAENLTEGSYLVSPRLTLEHTVSVPLDEAFVAGLYAGDGYMHCSPTKSRKGKASNGSYRVDTLSIAFDVKYRAIYEDIFNSLGADYKISVDIHPHGTTGNLSIYNAKYWQRCLDSVNFTYSPLGESKHSDILNWNQEAQLEYVRGFFLADGTVVNGGGSKNSRSVYCTLFNTNRQLMEQLLIVCKQWFDVKLCWYDRKDFEEYGHTVHCKRMYYIRFTGKQCSEFMRMMGDKIMSCKSFYYKPLRTTTYKLKEHCVDNIVVTPKIVKEVKPSGPATVYNIQVAEDESYIVHDVAVHNCKHLYVVLQVFPYLTKAIASKFKNWATKKIESVQNSESDYMGKYKVRTTLGVNDSISIDDKEDSASGVPSIPSTENSDTSSEQ